MLGKETIGQLKGFKVDKAGPAPGQQVLAELAAVQAMVAAHATAEEASAFGAWLLATAQAAANSAKEGGFMGMGGTAVTEAETAALKEVAEALGVAA